jgi:outer membrane protein assembly factor BamB
MMRIGAVVRRGAAVGAVALLVAGASLAWAAVVNPKVTPTWQTNGRVNAIQVVGSTVYIGGKFTSVRPAGDPLGTGEVTRNRVAAFNIATGALLPWNPNASGTVQAIAVKGSTVYLGGSFTKVGGKGHQRLAAVDATTGTPIAAFKPTMDAEVLTLALAGSDVYAGGMFTTVNGAAHTYLAALNGTSGVLDPAFTGSADNGVLASTMTADGTKLVIGGNFTHVDGSSQNHIAAVSPTTGATLPWATHTSYGIVALAADASGIYAAGAGNGGNFAAFNPSTGSSLWVGGTNGNVQAITVFNGEVYAGGHYTNYCGPQGGQHTCTNPIPRSKILAVDETTGALQSWAPSVDSALGVFALAGGAGYLELGGDFTKVAGTSQQGFAAFAQ